MKLIRISQFSDQVKSPLITKKYTTIDEKIKTYRWLSDMMSQYKFIAFDKDSNSSLIKLIIIGDIFQILDVDDNMIEYNSEFDVYKFKRAVVEFESMITPDTVSTLIPLCSGMICYYLGLLNGASNQVKRKAFLKLKDKALVMAGCRWEGIRPKERRKVEHKLLKITNDKLKYYVLTEWKGLPTYIKNSLWYSIKNHTLLVAAHKRVRISKKIREDKVRSSDSISRHILRNLLDL